MLAVNLHAHLPTTRHRPTSTHLHPPIHPRFNPHFIMVGRAIFSVNNYMLTYTVICSAECFGCKARTGRNTTRRHDCTPSIMALLTLLG